MKNTTIIHAFRSRPLPATLASLAPLLLALVAPVGAAAGEDHRAPDLGDCQKLGVPPGNQPSSRLFGVGTQNYLWDGARWVFVTPEAVLFAGAGDHDAVAIHFGGPTWASESGNRAGWSAR